MVIANSKNYNFCFLINVKYFFTIKFSTKTPWNIEYMKGENITLFVWFQHVIKGVRDLLHNWKRTGISMYYNKIQNQHLSNRPNLDRPLVTYGGIWMSFRRASFTATQFIIWSSEEALILFFNCNIVLEVNRDFVKRFGLFTLVGLHTKKFSRKVHLVWSTNCY